MRFFSLIFTSGQSTLMEWDLCNYAFWVTTCFAMPDVNASYGMSLDLIVFFKNFVHNWRIFMSEVLYFHQTFINCVFDVNIKIFSYNKLSDVAASYGTLLKKGYQMFKFLYCFESNVFLLFQNTKFHLK